jgi:PKD repeat protein
MAFAYYNRLPPWPVTVDHGQTWDPHVNNYGSYVADRYRFNELYYSETADAYGTTAYGGYGYMWTGSYSPNSRMKFYIENHYMTSNQLWTSSCTYNNTIIEINGGYVHPICNYLTTSGHLTLATGYVVGQHTLIFNDPYGNKNNPGYPNYTGYDSYYDWPGYNNGYQNLDASGSNGGVAWTVKSQTSQPLYNDTIIDNVDYNHGFYMSNVTNGSHMRYFHDFNTGYNGHTWWTYTMAAQSDICYTTWGPNLPQAGKYKVEVFIPSNGANASGARYHIHYNGGDTLIILDQVNYANQWVELGVFPFHSGQGDYVYLGDSTGIDNEMIAFDAMRWSFVPEISASFTSSNQIICAGETINYTNTCLHADSCKWILTGSDLNITNQPNPSAVYNSAGTYNVTLIAFSTYGNDTLYMPDYVTVNPLPQANFIAANTNIQLPGAIALFTNNSQNSSAYIWNFGDGALSTDQDPYHIYTSAGNFTVSLIASNGLCPSDTLIMTNYITVLNATDIFHNSSLTPVINANNGQLFILCGNTSLNNVTIKVTDEIGRNIITKEIERISTDFTFALPEIHGIFIISLSAENIESIFLKYVNY